MVSQGMDRNLCDQMIATYNDKVKEDLKNILNDDKL